MSETEIRESVYGFYQALTLRNLDKIQSILSDQALLSWGPYDFEGKEKILKWAEELLELFPFLSFKEKNLEVDGSEAKHEFMIAFLTAKGRKGWLPCEATYTFKDGKIHQVKIKLLHGFLAVSKDEIERVKPLT